jgi:hypothetical protein
MFVWALLGTMHASTSQAARLPLDFFFIMSWLDLKHVVCSFSILALGKKYAAPAASWLLDIVRGTVTFNDPFALVLFLKYLQDQPDAQVVRIKNKFLDAGGSEYRDVLVNVRFQGHVCEVQLALHTLLQMKKYMHKYYEVQRAEHFPDLLALFC